MPNSYSRQLANVSIDPNQFGLFAGYDMRSTDGTTIADVSGNGNTITLFNGPHQEKSILNDSFIFNSARTQYGQTAIGFTLSEVTISFWVKFYSTTNNWIINKYESAANDWGLRTSGGNVYIYDNIGSAGTALYSTAVTIDKWYHIALVLTSLYENKLYINGQLKGSGTLSSAGFNSITGRVYLSTRAGTAGNFPGKFGHLKVFNTELSADQIKAEYNQGKSAIWSTKYGANVSVAAVIGGNIENTPFRVLSGSHKISSYSINGLTAKAIECVTAGDIEIISGYYHPDNNDTAFGDYECWIEKASGHTTKIGFINQDRNNTANGYGVQITTDGTTTIEEWGIGSVVTGGSLTSGTLTKINLKRNTLGDAFEGFIDGISFGTGSDSTIVKSYYSVFSLGIGDKIVYADRNGGHAIVKRLVA